MAVQTPATLHIHTVSSGIAEMQVVTSILGVQPMRAQRISMVEFDDYESKLRSTFEQICSEQCQERPADIAALLESFYALAYDASLALFGIETLSLLNDLLTSTPDEAKATLEFYASGDGLSFPWELVVLNESQSLTSFLGFQALGRRSPMPTIGTPPQKISAPGGRFRVGAAFYSRNVTKYDNWDDFLQRAHTSEYPYIAKHIVIEELPRLTGRAIEARSGPTSSNETFRNFLEAPHEIKHFACHAEHGGQTLIQTNLIVDDHFPVAIGPQMRRLRTELRSPMIFINACSSLQSPSKASESIAALLLEKGARLIVGTIARVPSKAARDFAHEFYQELFTGASAGSCLSVARRRFFAKNQFFPFVYCCFGNSTISLDIGGAAMLSDDLRDDALGCSIRVPQVGSSSRPGPAKPHSRALHRAKENAK